ncbi:MCM2/3/5 family-domain-containing protein [Blastocladiella britannica]|nr:MCM2/3/5 family-domain-containing protein [Blastocladiella britannica]
MALLMAHSPVLPVPRSRSSTRDAFNERITLFTNFLERDFKENSDYKAIKDLVKHQRTRLIVDIDDVRAYNLALATSLLASPMDYLPAFDRALTDLVVATYSVTTNSGGAGNELGYNVGLRGSFGDHHVNPRTLSSSNIGTMVALEGIVTRCSLVRPKMLRSVHYCDATHLFTAREYRDATMLGPDVLPTGTTYPTADENGNPLTTEFGYCTFRDHQGIAVQEMPERAPPGQLPRSIDVMLDGDLVDACKPGDRVQIVGVYRAVSGGVATGVFRTVVLANNVRHLDKEIAQPKLTETDVKNIRKLALRKNIVDLLARSLAPSIFGHPWIKKALLLQLLGGLEHNLANGTHIRGDINILLLGDPSTAKSQFLRFVMQMAPLAIATTGRGSSGVGLTAAVTQDSETGERRLEAGAMVLADRGVVCIDEFDKMSDADRVAIHEVMEQQTITIAKAGIHTTLNARCSVVAAANPTYGQYDENLEPHRNIRLPDSLLSRFDLLFVILDKTDEATDRRLSSHVLRMHRYLPPGVEEGQPLPTSLLDPQFAMMEDAAAESAGPSGRGGGGADRDVPVFEKAPHYLQMQADEEAAAAAEAAGGSAVAVGLYDANGLPLRRSTRQGGGRRGGSAASTAPPAVEILSLAFMKKYLHYAKARVKPTLTPTACEVITEAYARFRNEKSSDADNKRRTLPVTARTLETLIRLATAHAKARLAREVSEEDAEAACELVEYALFKEFKKKKRPTAGGNKRRKVDVDGAEGDSDSDDGDDGGEDKGGKAHAQEKDGDAANVMSTAPWAGASQEQDPLALLDPTPLSLPHAGVAAGTTQDDEDDQDAMDVDASSTTLDPARLGRFRVALDVLFQDLNGTIPIDDVSRLVNSLPAATVGRAGGRVITFTHAQVQAYLAHLEEKQSIFIDHDSGQIFRV